MAKPRTNDADLGQLTLFAPVEFFSNGDGSFRAVPQKPVMMASITRAAKITGKSRQNIYRLFRAGFIKGNQSSPGKIQIDMMSLYEHVEESGQNDYWTTERKNRYRGN